MNGRRNFIFYFSCIVGTFVCISLYSSHIPPALAQDPAPTPTDDRLAQPGLPPNPTELEMGRYLFWRHCMPCHGDVGQGLTDEFRVLWEDHQNCWDRGCHGGKSGDEGFPIPTVIPAIVTEDHLTQFTSEEELFDYLKATHPPQYPGFLEDEEYHDIITVLFTMNERTIGEDIVQLTSPAVSNSPLIPTFTPPQAPTRSFSDTKASSTFLITGISVVILVMIAIQLFRRFKRKDV